MTDQPVRVRIAPSPTGDPHVGTAYIGLFDYVLARQSGGQFVLRLEDTDRERFRESSSKAILGAMDWLGIPPDESPEVGGPHGPYVQSERLAVYREYVQQLIEAGHAYYCFCSKDRLTAMRAAQEEAKAPVMYDRYCLETMTAEERAARVAHGESHVVRMVMPREGSTSWNDLIRDDVTFENALLDDQVLQKADGYPTYHLANVVDDHLMRITHVIRAEEWISSTPKHLVLYRMFGWDAPLFAHVPLLRNPDRSKISKRHSHTSLQWYHDEGFLPEALLNFLALLGWSHPEEKEVFGVEEMVEKFSFSRFNKSGPIFDLEKLRWLNGVYIRNLSPEDLYVRVEPLLQRAGFVSLNPSDEEVAHATRCIVLEQEKVRQLIELPDLVTFLFNADFAYEDEVVKKWLNPAPAHVRPVLTQLAEQVAAADEDALTAEHYEAMVRAIAEALGIGAGKAIHPLRAAISGRAKGPSLFHMMEVLGKDDVLYRIRRALGMVKDAE